MKLLTKLTHLKAFKLLGTGWVLLSLITAGAEAQAGPPALTGWTHLQLSGFLQDGILLRGTAPTYSSPVIAEIDGDPSNGKEVAVGGEDGRLHVYRSSGQELWSAALPSVGCALHGIGNRLFSSPAVGAIYGDGVPYVVIGYGGFARHTCDGGAAAYRGSDGRLSWKFSTKRFAHKEHFWSFMYGVFSSPALADVDGDGKMEIGFGSFDRNVYLLNANGSVRWYYMAADTVWSSPAFADVDGDSSLELLIGTDISKNSRLRPPTPNGGYVYALKTKPRQTKRIGFRQADAIVWMTTFDQVIDSSPVVADVLPDNPGPEVLIGSGCYFPENGVPKRGQWVKILRLEDGKVLQTLPTQACQPSSPAVGDLDDDGVLEVVVTTNGATRYGGDGHSRVMAWKADKATLLWSVVPHGYGHHDPFGGDYLSPVIGDLDGNGSLEVVAANADTVNIFNGKDGTPLTCQNHACDDALLLYTQRSLKATPALGDLDDDGQLEVVIGGASTSRGKGALYAWTGFAGLLSSPPGLQPAFSAPWPMTRGNPAHTGVYGN